jgi:hypothetical protein
MKYKIGIFGSAAGDLEDVLPKSETLGKLLGQYKDRILILTGAGPGLPFIVAKEAAAAGVEVWGFSAALDLKSQKQSAPDVDTTVFKKLIYLPAGLPLADNVRVGRKYRNVTSTATCDAGIIISGRWGSLNEFTNLMDMQKLVGVWTGTGGVADELPALTQKITKEGQGTVFFDDDPARLLTEIMKHL